VPVSGPIDPPIARIVDRVADFFEAELAP
jgi:hypothetical protein